MQKSQELPFDMGKTNGGYFATTNGYNVSDVELHNWWLDHAARYADGVASINKYLTKPVWLGTQTFGSTTRPLPLFNNCSNVKWQGLIHPITYTCENYNSSYLRHAGLLYSYGVVGSSANAVPFYPNWNDADGASRRAWWSMQPRFEGEFQALNFIYELKDFKDIAKHLARLNVKDIRSSLARVKRKISYAKTRIKNGSTSSNMVSTLNAASKVCAEAVLTKNFAIDPTARDLITLHGQLVTLVSEVQNEFFERGKDTQSSHYTEVLFENESLTPGTRNNYWKGVGERQVVKFTATMQYQYDYRMRSWFDALKRYYGLNLNASVVWNALPFTFLVDYVLKVGQAMDFMRTDPNVELRLMQYCESILAEATSGRHLLSDDRTSVWINGAPSTDRQIMQGYRGSSYQRKVTHPNKGAALPRLTLPSTKQLGNVVALLRVMW